MAGDEMNKSTSSLTEPVLGNLPGSTWQSGGVAQFLQTSVLLAEVVTDTVLASVSVSAAKAQNKLLQD